MTTPDRSPPSRALRSPRVVLAGLGSPYRRDDAAGQLVAERVAKLKPAAIDIGPVPDPLDLLGRWDGADLAVIIDAVRSGRAPGTVSTLELEPAEPTSTARLGATGAHGAASTHGIGLAGVLRLARAVGAAPRRVVVVGIEGEDFAQGVGLSPAVATALPGAVDIVVGLVEAQP
ncbi:MAG TPA: hydrogenase maturation protease [Acidimicrobiales bacterium]|nr:hydrogenase maturation protease [Acidimicrobiales bacterium]